MKETKYNRAHKIKAHPLAIQKPGLVLFMGHSRKVFNLLLDWNREMYILAEDGIRSYPTIKELGKELTQIKNSQEFSYLNEAPSGALQSVVNDLWVGIRNARHSRARAPKHRKKNAERQTFHIKNDVGAIVYRGHKAYFKCPKLKKLCGNDLIPLAEKPRFDGKIMSYTVVKEGDDWWVVVNYELTEDPRTSEHPDSVCGVDVGIHTPAVCSDGTELHLPDTSREEAKIRYYQSKMDRSRNANPNRQHVSNRYKKVQKKKRALQKRVNNKRIDAIHKYTHEVTNNHGTVVVDAPSIQKIIKNMPGRGARKAASKANMGEILRQLKYKALNCIEADKYYPSSQLCSVCGHRHSMPLNQRTYVCEQCGAVIDRDLNAARNLANYISQARQA